MNFSQINTDIFMKRTIDYSKMSGLNLDVYTTLKTRFMNLFYIQVYK